MKEIFLFRHGDIARTNCYIGATDVKLSDVGIRQLSSQKKLFSNLLIDKIFCSPLKRCIQTYSQLQLDSKVSLDDRIREVDFGDWEGKSFENIAANHPSEITRWSIDKEKFVFPNGEAVKDFHQRIIAFCEYIKTLPEPKILIISHGGVIRHMICYLLNIPLDNYLYFHIDYGHLSTLKLYSEGGVLTSLNKGM